MIKTLALCQGRHNMPENVEGSIFGSELNPTDLKGMHVIAEEMLADVTTLNLYVTGLTVALGEVVKVCWKKQINLNLFHYNRDTNDYYEQVMFQWKVCPFCGARNDHNSWYCGNCGAT